MHRRSFTLIAAGSALCPRFAFAQDQSQPTEELKGIDRGGEKYPSGGLGLGRDAFEDLYGGELDDEFELFTSFKGDGDFQIDIWKDQFPAAYITLQFGNPMEFDVARLLTEDFLPDDASSLNDDYFLATGSFVARYHSDWLSTAHEVNASETDWWFWSNAEPGDFILTYQWDPSRDVETVGSVVISLGDNAPESRE